MIALVGSKMERDLPACVSRSEKVAGFPLFLILLTFLTLLNLLMFPNVLAFPAFRTVLNFLTFLTFLPFLPATYPPHSPLSIRPRGTSNSSQVTDSVVPDCSHSPLATALFYPPQDLQ
jgi:hypothetical protein